MYHIHCITQWWFWRIKIYWEMNWFKKLWGKWFKIQHLERIYIGLPYCPIHLSLSIKYLKWKWKSWFLANVFISANHKSAVISWQNLLLESKLMKIFLLMKTLLKCWFYSDFDLASQFFFSTNLHIFTKPTRPSQIADKMGKKIITVYQCEIDIM
jgi:hypothetical protein